MWRVQKFIYTERLNNFDEEFVFLVFKDIEEFLKENQSYCILLFPPLDNRRRYLIHKVGQLLSVKTFSVGEGYKRTTVVCNFIKSEKGESDMEDVQYTNISDTKVVLENRDENKGAVAKSKRKIRPDAPIYLPPAARLTKKSEKKVVSVEKANISKNDKTSRRRKLGPIKEKENITNSTTAKCEDKSIELELNNVLTYTPLKERKWVSLSHLMENIQVGCKFSVIASCPDIYKLCKKNTILNNVMKNDSEIPNVQENTESCNIKINDDDLSMKNQKIHNQVITTEKQLWIDKNSDSDEQELVRASEEINRRNKRIMKQSFSKSDILIISDTDLDENTDIDTVDCWEDLLDEKGQLEKDMLMEITERVGDVNINKAKEDYRDYLSKSTNEDYSHIVEIYDFPREFQTRDLVTIFDNHRCTNFHIKWVDDNHALGIFSSGFAVNEVLTINHPLLKVRPFSEASKQSIAKAKRYPNAMVPFAVRPQTCPQTARRMVSGALGLKLNREDRAKEIEILKEAREKKKLSAKLQNDIWEGKS